MSLHQIIYTSCMRGINGVNDGQQVFSYDASFTDANNDEVKRLFSYQPPALDQGVIMSEAIVPTLPKSFIYRKLNSGAGALALNTYLGRDYMGSAGRFGNYLSHVVLADVSDIQNYPCEFYGSGLLRDCMQFDEVNNPNKPDFLPAPVLERGFTVDIDAVIEFLSVDDRIEVFKNMLCAVLAFEAERKRVVICDEPSNIVMWIAAIEYALPLRTALNINFSTYDFDPALSVSQICGVVPKGTRYAPESKSIHFVFDLFRDDCAEFEKDERYFEFIDTAMSFSYESLQAFFRFIVDGYTYDKADCKMYAAYRLYCLLTDGIGELSQEEIHTALEFAREFALPAQQRFIILSFLEQRENLMRTDSQTFLCVMRYAIEKYDALSENERAMLKEITIDRVLSALLNNQSGESEFAAFYDEMDSACRKAGFALAPELLKPNNREKLLAVMQNDTATWKMAFVVRIVTAFAKEQRVSVDELLVESPLGQVYYGFVQAVYVKNAQNGFFLLTCILDGFASDCRYLVNKALNLEGMLLDLPNGNQEAAAMWKYFAQTMMKHQQSNFEVAYSILGKYQRYEQSYNLFSSAMAGVPELADRQLLFREHYNAFVSRDREYAAKYGKQILADFYGSVEGIDSECAYSAKLELFAIVSAEKIDVPFAENLIKELVKTIPFESPSRENGTLLQNAFEYLYNLRKPVTGKLLLLVIATFLEKCKNVNQLHNTFENLARLTANGKADISRVPERSAERYFDWLLPAVCVLCERKSDIESLFNLFEMPSNAATLFFTSYAKNYMKFYKGENVYAIFCEFLGVVFERGNAQSREEIGKLLCKLNRQKLADLDRAVKERYYENGIVIGYWHEMKNVAEATSPLRNNLSNLFKRKKD